VAKVVGTLFKLLLAPLNKILSREARYDSCSGSYFLGIKDSRIELSHKEILILYKGLCR
jgi:hypothetical protein